MEYNINPIDQLTDFAKNSSRLTDATEMAYPSSINQPTHHRKTIYIKNNTANPSFFIAFHDPKAFGDGELFCGVFIPIAIPLATKARIQKKNIFDKFNLFSKKKFLKTGFQSFDSEFVISGEDTSGLELVLENKVALIKIMESFDVGEGLFISFNEFNVDFVPELTGKSYVSILTTQKWITEISLIEKLFARIEEFI